MNTGDTLFSLEGKTALVTGGTSGIGAMIARGLIGRGVKTYITGRDAASVSEVAQEMSAGGGTCIGLPADLSGEAGPVQLAVLFAAHEDELHLLVNNAGAIAPGGLDDMEVDDWDLVMKVNLRAAYFLVRELLPQLRAGSRKEARASVVNIGSIGGLHVPNWEAHSYGASKAALHHLTRSLAKTLGKDQINVNSIAPGPFPTRMTDTSTDAVKKSVATYIPLGRPGSAEDIEGAIVFLASRAGAYVNGHTIPLDGGYIAAL